MPELDKIDLHIIDSLTKDARTSFRSIASELGISPDTVMNRFRKLQDIGLIRGSTVVLDSRMIGYNGMAVFNIDTMPSHIMATEATSDSSTILERLIKMRNIIVATKTVGEHDLLAIGVVKDFSHLMKIEREIAEIPGVKDIQVSFWVEKTELCPKYFIV